MYENTKNITPIRVLYIFSAKNAGGGELLTESLIIRNKLKVTPIVLCQSGPFIERIKSSGIEIIIDDTLKKLDRSEGKELFYKYLITFVVNSLISSMHVLIEIKRQRIKVVHVNNLNAASKILPAIFLSKTLFRFWYQGISWICTRHEAKYIAAIDKLFNLICVTIFDTIICISKHVIDGMPEIWVKKSKLHLIYNGIDYDLFNFNEKYRNTFRSKYQLKKDDITIALVGRISKEKGALFIVELFGKLITEYHYKNCKLMLIGPVEKSIKISLDTIIAKYSVSDATLYVDKLDKMNEVYSGLDIVVNASLPDYGESFGLTIAEAMACKRIVLAVQLGGLIEIVENGYNGFLCKHETFLSQLITILQQWNKIDGVREHARKTIIEKFPLAKMIEEYNQAYTQH